MSKSANKAKKEELYGMYGKRCMMTGSKKCLTYHHIDKLDCGGPTTVENGAVLSSVAQQWLHNLIERTDKGLFYLINDCLELYKKVRDTNNQELIHMYNDEIIPLFIARIIVFDRRNVNKNTRDLTNNRQKVNSRAYNSSRR